jgi:hypothetical protein
MTTYTGRGGHDIALGIKLTEVLYVPSIRQWISILRSQANASGAVDLGHPKGPLLAGAEFVGTLLSEHPPEH